MLAIRLVKKKTKFKCSQETVRATKSNTHDKWKRIGLI